VQSQEQPDDTVWVTPIEQSKPATTNRRRIARTAGILGVGVAAGGVLAFGLNANASPSSTSTGASAAAASQYGAAGDNTANAPRARRDQLALSGTVTAVGSNSVTIKTSTATTQYVVDANSDIDKNGEATLADLKVGDAVTFNTVTTNGKATIDKLHSGDEAKNRPAGAGGHGLSLSGTVTSVGSASVTIKTSTGTTEYAVDALSDIDKNGEATLADLKVGDAVTFNTVTTNGRATIDKLHSGDEAKNRPAGPPPGQPGTGSGSA
jgi:Cu/Ag efflux protein CusF